MTLTKLKTSFKLVSLILAFIVYSAGLFLLGKYENWSITSNSNINTGKTAGAVEKPLPQNDVQSASVLGSTVKLCSNTLYAFQLAYPQDWFTTYNTNEQACNYFAPYSFILPQVPDANIAPITIFRIKPEDWDVTVKAAQNPNDLYNVETTKNIAVNGSPVQFISATSTGTTLPRGFVKQIYFVFNANNPLELSYTQLDDKENIDENEKVLKDIVNSLKFF